MIEDSSDFRLSELDNKILVDIFEDQMSSLGNMFHFCTAKDKLKLLGKNDPLGN